MCDNCDDDNDDNDATVELAQSAKQSSERAKIKLSTLVYKCRTVHGFVVFSIKVKICANLNLPNSTTHTKIGKGVEFFFRFGVNAGDFL